MPAIAGGAVAAGLAGGIAIGRNHRGRRLPKLGGRESVTKALGSATTALGKTALEVGKTGYRLGELTTEVRRVRERVSDD